MLWTIAKREFLDHVMSFRFSFVLVFTVVLVVLGTVIQVRDLERRLEDYEAQQARLQEEAGQAKIFYDVRLGVGRRPPMLSFLCAGRDREMPRFTTTGILSPPLGTLGIPVLGSRQEIGVIAVGFSRRSRAGVVLPGQNPLMLRFRALDFVFVVATFLSLLAFLLSFDSITGESEAGTMPVMLANSVSRATVLMGKAISGVGCLAVALTVSLNAALIVGLRSSRIALSAADWGRIGLLFLASLLFLGGLFVLGMIVSSRAGRSATSLILLLLIWTVMVVLVPNVSSHVAGLVQRTASDEEYFRTEMAGGKSLYQLLETLAREHPAAAWMTGGDLMRGVDRISGHIPYARSMREAPREAVEWYVPGTEAGNELILRRVNSNWQVYDARFRELLRQRRLAEWLARLSPSFAFTNLGERIMGTHPSAGTRFAQQAKRFYDRFVASVRQEGGLGLRFFTPLKLDDFLPVSQYRRVLESEGERAISEIYEEKLDRAQPIRGLPTFRFRPESIVDSVVQIDLALLMLLPGLFFLCAYAAFVRRNVGGD